MNKLDELVEVTRQNTAESERISQRLEALNKEMEADNNKKAGN